MTAGVSMEAKEAAAARIAAVMQHHALPDSRFQLNCSQFIPDFEGGDAAAQRLVAESAYRQARYVFVTPDNALSSFRQRAIAQGKTLLVPTYGLHRGFLLVDPIVVPRGHERYAAWLDGIEYFGRMEALPDLARRGPIDLIVAGASAVNAAGLRFGMGHRYLDIEWGILAEIGVVHDSVPVVALVHDAQYTEEVMPIEADDILADLIVTPTRTLRAASRPRPSRLNWQLVDGTMREASPLRYLRDKRTELESATVKSAIGPG
jgi:5-formyltetrahydrofolate cyclo-ligase